VNCIRIDFSSIWQLAWRTLRYHLPFIKNMPQRRQFSYWLRWIFLNFRIP